MIDELARHAGYHPTRYTKGNFEDKYIKIDSKNYIPKNFLTSKRDLEALSKCTNMDNFMTLPYCAKFLLGVSEVYLRNKIRFQRETGQKIYDIKRIQGNYFFIIPVELQEKIKKYVSYTITDFSRFNDFTDVKDSYILGDNLIVFM
uniref:hypothetical protein n=1 Tax=Aliarcobacter sp. TaxID=2321116 RepID=UPI004048D8B2